MEANRDLVRRFFPAMFGQDRDALRELLTDDVEWHVPPFAVERWGDVKGRDAVIEWLCGAGDEFYQSGSFKLGREVEAIEAGQGVVMGWMTATTSQGKPYANRYAFGFDFRDGAISGVWELLDSMHFQAQME